MPTVQSLEILAICKAWSHYCFRNRNALGAWHSPKGMPTFGWCLLLGCHPTMPTCNTWQLICTLCTLNFIALDVSWNIFSLKLAHKTKLSNVFGGAFWEPKWRVLKGEFFVPFYARSLSIVNQCKPMKQLEIWRMKWTGKFDGQNSLNCIRKYWWIIVASLNDLTCMKPTPENEMNFNGWLWYHNSTLVIMKLYT